MWELGKHLLNSTNFVYGCCLDCHTFICIPSTKIVGRPPVISTGYDVAFHRQSAIAPRHERCVCTPGRCDPSPLHPSQATERRGLAYLDSKGARIPI